MKKIKYLFMLIIGSMLLTGCIKYNATMDIKKDKSMDFSIIYAFDKTIFGEGNSPKEEDMKQIKKQGFTVTKYSEGNYEGFNISKKIDNIDEVSTESDTVFNLSGMMEETDNKYIFKVVKGTDKNTYYAKLKFDSNDSGLNESGNNFDDEDLTLNDEENLPDENDDLLGTTGENSLNNLDLNAMMGSLDLKFNVKLPNPALSSNATEKSSDNKNLTWKLGTEKAEYIEFAFEIGSSKGFNMLYVGIGALILVLVIVIAVVLSKKKNNNNVNVSNNTVNNNEPQPIVKE